MVTVISQSTKKTRYTIIPEYRLIVESLHGMVDLRMLCALRRIEMRDPVFQKGFDIISDVRNAQLNLSASDLLEFAAHQEAINWGNTPNKTAILAATPKQIALSYMLLRKSGKTVFDGEVFSTIEGLSDWFGNLNIETLQRVLNFFD
jgi:hypothetical protein